MPTVQITITADDSANFISGSVTSITPVTVYKQVNLAGRYKAKLIGVNWCDTETSTATAVANNYIATINSSTWSFPSNAQLGFQVTNKVDHVLMVGAEPPEWEIRNTGANMDISLSVQQFKAGPTADNAAFWSATKFVFCILTLQVEKVSEMI